MISRVSSSAAVTQHYVQNQPASKPPAKPKEPQKHDTVVLSQQAQKAAGDPDHDGD